MSDLAVDLNALEEVVRKDFPLSTFGIGRYLTHREYGLLCDPGSGDLFDRIPYLVGPKGKLVRVFDLDPKIGYTSERVNAAIYGEIWGYEKDVQFLRGESCDKLFENHYFCRIPLLGKLGARKGIIIDGVGLFPFKDAQHPRQNVHVHSVSEIGALRDCHVPISQEVGVYDYKKDWYIVSLAFSERDLDSRTVSHSLKFRWVIRNIMKKARAEYSSSTFLFPDVGRGGYCSVVSRRAILPIEPEDAGDFLHDLKQRRIWLGQRESLSAPLLGDDFDVVYRSLAGMELGIIHRRAYPRNQLQVLRETRREN